MGNELVNELRNSEVHSTTHYTRLPEQWHRRVQMRGDMMHCNTATLPCRDQIQTAIYIPGGLFNTLRRPLSTYPGVVAFRLQLSDLFLPLQQVFARLVQFLGQRRKLLQNKAQTTLTLILLMWRIGWAPNNASKWQIGFNWVFKGLNLNDTVRVVSFSQRGCKSYPFFWNMTLRYWVVTGFPKFGDSIVVSSSRVGVSKNN
jgi:hypothetical protein